MKQTTQERYFTYFIMTLVVLVMLFVVMPAKADTCRNADKLPCEDRIGAEVFFEKVPPKRFKQVCGSDHRTADACARLNVSRRQCTIYYVSRTLDEHVVNHELNHCRGWFHKGDSMRAHKRAWVDLDTYLKG